jgi:pSer/pThr/pTyr-binding forkhead associated (FHA) protein
MQGPEFLIGRGADCDLRLPVSAISRHHCLIRLHGAEATLVDLGSSNGTFVNGKRVRSQAPLHSGDEIRLGNSSFRVDLGDAIDLDAQPPVDPTATTCKLKVADPDKSPGPKDCV